MADEVGQDPKIPASSEAFKGDGRDFVTPFQRPGSLRHLEPTTQRPRVSRADLHGMAALSVALGLHLTSPFPSSARAIGVTARRKGDYLFRQEGNTYNGST